MVFITSNRILYQLPGYNWYGTSLNVVGLTEDVTIVLSTVWANRRTFQEYSKLSYVTLPSHVATNDFVRMSTLSFDVILLVFEPSTEAVGTSSKELTVTDADDWEHATKKLHIVTKNVYSAPLSSRVAGIGEGGDKT